MTRSLPRRDLFELKGARGASLGLAGLLIAACLAVSGFIALFALLTLVAALFSGGHDRAKDQALWAFVGSMLPLALAVQGARLAKAGRSAALWYLIACGLCLAAGALWLERVL